MWTSIPEFNWTGKVVLVHAPCWELNPGELHEWTILNIRNLLYCRTSFAQTLLKASNKLLAIYHQILAGGIGLYD